ncbi:uncharacterized protein [Antedon mediterranea]|uniref:uncharacterized protein n=1 Tax=Antedon mediterranea TaxID=105859 RepID=UPI003AF5809E
MSIEYYQKVKELQRLQHAKEQERMDLDQQLNTYLKSGRNMSRFKAAKLQSYWQKICDDERKSRARNEQLLKDFQRVQTHMDALTARTERLRMLKEQYELQVEKMYPRWKERLELKQQQKQRLDTKFDENEYQRLNRLRLQSASLELEVPPHLDNPKLQVTPDTHMPQLLAHHLPEMDQSLNSQRPLQTHTVKPAVKPSNKFVTEYEKPKEGGVGKKMVSNDDYDYPYAGTSEYEVPQSFRKDGDMTLSGTQDSIKRFHPDITSPKNLMHDKKKSTDSESGVLVRNNHGGIEEHGLGISVESENDYHPLNIKSPQVSAVKKDDSLGSVVSGASQQHSAPTLSRQKPVETDLQESSPERKESTSTAFTSETEGDEEEPPVTKENLHGIGIKRQETIDIKQEAIIPFKETSDVENGSDSEIGSKTSLPLSDDGSKTQPALVDTHKKSSEPEDPAVTVDGLWHMIKAIELEIEESDEVDMVYNAPLGTQAIIAEIVKEANNKKSLRHLNPNTVSMVILKELPLIIRKSSGGCLISDKMLTSTMPCSEVRIRSYMYSASLAIWDRLLQHFATLLQREIFSIEEIASKFAPLMIKAESVDAHKTKAIQILKDVLAVIPLNETLDETVSSIGGATPNFTQNNRTSTRQDGSNNQVPPLDLQGMKSDSEESVDSESSSHNKVPLNETDAYQQMMRQLSQPGDDLSEGEVSGLEGDEYSDHEDSRHSKPAHPSLATPPSSARSSKGKRNVLSSLGGSLGITYENNEDTPRSQIETDRSEAVSSLDATPRESGYVPSAMDQSLKSTGKSDRRSAAFWGNESDIESESEMTVPMGTGTTHAGTMKSDEFVVDDFEFYD